LKTKRKHKNIPVFIPHLGCPNDCVFCNQRTISGTHDFDITSVRSIIDRALSTIDLSSTDVQLAFFGGSFTGIDRRDMMYLLGLGKEYIDSGSVSSIRISTRPDYISPEILDILTEHGVKSIELGIQSFSDKVLAACGRGHTASQSRKACRMITERGCFELVGQMMIALPCSTAEDDRNTAREIASLGANAARIYPTMVFAGTKLEAMYRNGSYLPPTLEQLIDTSADVFEIFTLAGVGVIRIGLAESDGLHEKEGIIAGEYHPAMGELVISEYYRRAIAKSVAAAGNIEGKELIVSCAPGETSKIIGQSSANKRFIYSKFNVKKLKVIEKSDILRYNYIIDII